MTKHATFFHTLMIDNNQCIGCSHCVSVCPTEAFRVKNGKSILIPNNCVDCGECTGVCPTEAISIADDEIGDIFRYKYRVALVPFVFIGQFPKKISTGKIYDTIKQLGFTHIYEVENAVEILKHELPAYQKRHPNKLLLSSFCPAIVRLIQVRFPSLTDQLILQKTPLDIAANFVQDELVQQGIPPEETGIFYITPCAAKTVAIKDPVGEYEIPVTGTINMNTFFNKVYGHIERSGDKESGSNIPFNTLSPEAAGYTLTGGETQIASGKSLAIDGIHNVIEFLEKVENREVGNLDFLELRACDESCAGGVLTARNKFLTVNRLRQQITEKNEKHTETCFPPILSRQKQIAGNMKVNKVLPRSMMKLDDDINAAFKKMAEINEIMQKLPQVDCTMCGAPNCKSFANDIVQGQTTIEHCIFIQKKLEKKGKLTQNESAEKFNSVWGLKL